MRQIEINNSTWTVGLWWQDLDPNEKPRNKIQNILKDFNDDNIYNVFAHKDHVTSQLGLGKTEDEKKSLAKPSLAATLCEALESNSFLGWFRLSEDQIWVVAVADGSILADGDLCGTEEEVLPTFEMLEQLDEAQWENDIQIYDDVESAHEQLTIYVSNIKPKGKLQSVKRKLPIVKISIGILLFAMLAGGIYGYIAYKDYKKEQERLARQEAFKKKLAAQNTEPIDMSKLEKKHFPKKWLKEPTADRLISYCRKQQKSIPISENGWLTKGFSCGKNALVVTIERGDNVSFLSLPKNYNFNTQEPNIATKRIEHNIFKNINRPKRKLLSLNKASAHIFELARKIKASVEVKVENLQPKQVTVKGKTKTVFPVYKKGNFLIKMENQFPYFGIEKTIQNIPGLVVEKIDFKDKKVELKGVFYAKK